MADISFLVFEDEKGHYRMEGDDPDNQTRIDMSQEEADIWIHIQSMKNAFPVGCFVRAFRDGEMWAGIVKSHTPEEGYLTVKFSNLQCVRYAYIEMNDTPDSMVVYQFSGGLANNVQV
jgi:hypothetical protein